MALLKEILISEIPAQLKQVFHHEYKANVSMDAIAKMYASGQLTTRDLKIVELIFNMQCVTPSQVARYLNESVGAIQARMDKLINSRVLNKFILTDNLNERINPLMFQVYCLDFGGKYLLENYSTLPAEEWMSSHVLKDSEWVKKHLLSMELLLTLFSFETAQVEYFKSDSRMRYGRTTLRTHFEFALKDVYERAYFIGEVVSSKDLPYELRGKIQKYEELLMGNAWKKVFYDAVQPPALILICESDEQAKEVGLLITQTTDLTHFYLTTPKRLVKDCSEMGTFLEYEWVLQRLNEVVFDPFKATQ